MRDGPRNSGSRFELCNGHPRQSGTEARNSRRMRAHDMESLDPGLETAVETRRSQDTFNRLAKSRIKKPEPVDIELEPGTSDDMVETSLPSVSPVEQVEHANSAVLPCVGNRGAGERFDLAVHPVTQPPGTLRRQVPGNDSAAQAIGQTMQGAGHIAQEPGLGPLARLDRGERIRRQSER